MKRELRAPTPHFSAAPEQYSRENESQFRNAVVQYIQDAIEFVGKASIASPSALASGSTDDYDPGPRATTLRLTPDAGGSTITGLQQGSPGRRIRIVSLAGNLTITNEDTGSTAANRITVPAGVDVVLSTNDLVDLEYDSVTERWRVVFSTGVITTVSSDIPIVYAAALQTPIDDGSGDLTAGVYWTYQAATYPDYTVTVDLYVGGVLVETDTGVDPATSQPYTITDTGGGNLAGPQTAYVRVRLIRAAGSVTISDVFSSPVDFDGYYPAP